MRNLKRALSLALASVMLLGMMVVGTGASYADVTSEDNKEAIEVLQTIGVMVGDDNGNFNPDAMVTREQMAVIMCNLLDYTVSTYKGTTKFTDVSPWALPYVEACYTNGIIAGYSETQFGGNDSVTTSQAALMILKALGYFQERGDFGNDWVVSTIRVGAQAKLFDGVNNGATEALTRNDVAQIVLNALKAECVMIGSHDLVADGNGGFTTKAVYTARTGTASKYNTIVGIPANTINLGEELYDGTLTQRANTTDAFGRPATKWSYKSSTIGTFPEQPTATYTAKASKGTLYDLLGSSVVNDLTVKMVDPDGSGPLPSAPADLAAGDKDMLVVYVDGALQSGPKTNYFVRNSSAAGNSGNGVLTEVYLDNDGNVTLVYVNTYLMKATADYSEKKGSVNVTTITAPTGLSTTTALSDKDFDVVDYAEDDYILYTASYNGTGYDVETIAPAEVVSGSVDAYSVANYVTLAGTKYEYAAGIEGAHPTTPTLSAATTYVVGDTASVVVDANGYVMYVDDASISTGNYVYIAATAQASNLNTTDIAQAYFGDGTVKEIKIDSLKNSAGVEQSIPTGYSTARAGWYSYSKNSSDEYTLKAAATSNITNFDPSTSTVTAIYNKKVNIGGVVTGDNSTVFVVKDKNNKVTTYTGIQNIPDITTTGSNKIGIAYMLSKDTAGKNASLVFVDATNANVKNTATESLLYVLKLDSTYVDKTNGDPINTYKVILNNEETTIDTKETWNERDIFEDYTVDNDGYYEKGTAFTDDTDKDIVTLSIGGNSKISYSNNVLTIAGTPYVINDDTQINLVMMPSTGTNAAKLANEIMTDDAAKYETVLGISANALANLFKDYKVAGSAYVTYADKADSDLVSNIYVVVRAVADA